MFICDNFIHFLYVCILSFFSTMKATTWLCPVLTLLCATKLVYTAQRGSYGGYPLDDMDSQLLQVCWLFAICHEISSTHVNKCVNTAEQINVK